MTSILTYRKPQSLRRRAQSDSFPTVARVKSAAANAIDLVSFDDLPEWNQDNPCVLTGYRAISNSWRVSAKSCMHVHNETMNIFTHLIPAVCLAIAQVLVQFRISNAFPEASILDRMVIGTNLMAAIITFSLSASYHALMNHSEVVSSLWLRIDYVGILTLILGSFLSGVYVGFYCEPGHRNLHWTMIFTLSVITAILVLHPRLQGLKYRSLRTYAFVATALTGFAPIGHGLMLYGWSEMWVRSGMPYYFLEGVIYLIGAFFFITRIPESIWPGSFDIWLSSHQLFHILVVVAAMVHIHGVLEAFSWNYSNARTCVARY